MDSILAIVALIAFYALQAMAAKKRKAAESRGEVLDHEGAPEYQGPEVEDEMADALAEIRQALGMGTPPPETQAPTQSPAPRQSPEVSQPKTPARSRPVETREAERLSDEFHRVKTGKPDAETSFNKRTSEWTTIDAPKRKWPTRKVLTQKTPLEERFESKKTVFRDPLKDHDHIALEPVAKAKSARVKRFATPKEIREGIIAAEILGPPKALRNRR